jgi:hypothetical protein
MKLKLIGALAAGLLSSAQAFAAPVTITFDPLGYGTQIGDTYASQGVSFSADALAVDNSLGAFIDGNPSGGSAMFGSAPSVYMNSSSALPGYGFIGDVTLSYASLAPLTIGVFDGLNGSGTQLATLSLDNSAGNANCTTAALCVWNQVTLNFSGLAKSIAFIGISDSVNGTTAAFDSVSVNAVPVPAAGWLLMSALGGLGTMVRRKRVAA